VTSSTLSATDGGATSPPAVVVRGLSKAYAGVQAVNAADVDIRAGEIHGLIGENGAGKSTLIKMLAGVVQPDAGTIEVGGAPGSLPDVAASESAGIRVLHQEFALVPRLTVAENVLLGHRLPPAGPFVSPRAIRAEAAAVLAPFAPDIDVRRKLSELPTAQRWLVAIARACTGEHARLVVLDEPTASLGEHEVEVLFAAVRRLAASGTAVLFVSHRLAEVMELADRTTVMRNGRVIGTFAQAELTRERMVELIVGEDRRVLEVAPVAPPADDVVLEVRDLHAGPLRGVSFALRRGEILGIGGLVGSGRSELLLALFGALPIDSGEVVLAGEARAPTSPADAVAKGLALLPEERRQQALFLRRSIRENLVVSFLDRFRPSRWLPVPSRRAELRATEAAIASLRIATVGPGQKIAELSGGNQQKVVVGRWLLGSPSVLLCDEPTRGVDVGAKAEAMMEIAELAARGAGVLFVSSDLEEVAHLSHRVLVLREGRVAADLPGPVSVGQILENCYREAA